MEPIASGKSHARTSRPSAVQRKTRQPTTSIQYKRCSCTSHTGPSPMIVFTSTTTSICMFLLDSFELHFGDPTTLLTSTAQRATREGRSIDLLLLPETTSRQPSASALPLWFWRLSDGDKDTVRIFEAEPSHRKTLVGLADNDILRRAYDF